MTAPNQVLHLWLVAAALDTEVIAWARYGGDEEPMDDGERPYRTGVDALDDGWALVQAPGSLGVDPTDGELGAEFVFQRPRPLG